MFSVRSDQHFGNIYLGGFGASVAEAKQDFLDSVTEAMNETGSFSIPEILFSYDLPSFFNEFDYINASKFARSVHINESKMRQYKSGAAFPNEKTTRKILSAIKRIGAELNSVTLI